jgi:hypothetical protein
MTAEKERSSSTPVLARAIAVLAALGLGACSTVGSPTPGGEPTVPGGPEDPGPGPGPGPETPGGDPPSEGDCGLALVAAQKVVNDYCVGCHGAQPAGNSFANIDDAKGLVATGKVVPDDPENSPLFQRISTNTMPPAGTAKRPEQGEIDSVRTWIACGALDWADEDNRPVPFTSINDRLDEIIDDLDSIPNEADRQDVRYIDLYNLANAGFSEERLEEYRQTVSFVMNSLSTGLRVVPPREVGDNRLLFRIELEDYGWDADRWNLLTEGYPYIVQYDDNSELFPYDQNTADEIVDETGEEIYVIQGDWFIANAMVPPLYNQLLDLPNTLPELEDQLGIDILADIENEQVARSGFLDSGPSDANRIIERHELLGNQGAFWISYDFADNLDEEGNDIFTDPIGFTCDGGEAIFNLPNGLQAYYVIAGDPLDPNNEAISLDIAPINVVQDPASFDGQVINGLSCANCHAVNGALPKNDQIRDQVTANGAGNNDINDVLALYPPRAEMQELFEEDANRYRSAMAQLGIDKITEKTVHTSHQRHLDELKISDVAAVLGITQEELENALDFGVNALPPALQALRRDDGIIDRDTLEAEFEELVAAIGLGNAVAPQN